MKLHVTPTLLAFGLWITVQAGWADPITFDITVFDVPGSTSTSANGINNAGQIVGGYTDSTGAHGFLDTNGTFTTLNFPGSTYTEATGINNLGQIVGIYSGGVFLYENGTFSNLNIPILLGERAVVNDIRVAINDAGHIVGTAPPNLNLESGALGYLYANGQLTFLPQAGLFEDVVPLSINNADVIAGWKRGSTADGPTAFVYSNGQYTYYYLGGPAGSVAYGINNLGHIVVNGLESDTQSVYLNANGVISVLPPTLPHSRVFEGYARGLNDSDQIVGSFEGGHSFLATPVPEPASILLLASGLAGVALLVRRSRAIRS